MKRNTARLRHTAACSPQFDRPDCRRVCPASHPRSAIKLVRRDTASFVYRRTVATVVSFVYVQPYRLHAGCEECDRAKA